MPKAPKQLVRDISVKNNGTFVSLWFFDMEGRKYHINMDKSGTPASSSGFGYSKRVKDFPFILYRHPDGDTRRMSDIKYLDPRAAKNAAMIEQAMAEFKARNLLTEALAEGDAKEAARQAENARLYRLQQINDRGQELYALFEKLPTAAALADLPERLRYLAEAVRVHSDAFPVPSHMIGHADKAKDAAAAIEALLEPLGEFARISAEVEGTA